MRRFVLGIVFFILLFIMSVAAYDLQVLSSSEKEIVIELANVKTLDIQIAGNVRGTAETATASDTYVVDARIERRENKIVLVADVSPLFEDYNTIGAITVRGTLSVEGVEDAFAKRVTYRGAGLNAAVRRAPTLESSTMVYAVTAVAALVILLVIALLIPKKKRKNVKKRKAKRSRKKRKVKR